MVQNNMKVTIAYTLKDANGEVVDQAPHNNPLTYIHGHQSLLPGLETALEGRAIGEHFYLQLPPESAYGAYDPDLVLEIDREELADVEELAVGVEVEMFLHDDEDEISDEEVDPLELEDEDDEDDEDEQPQAIFIVRAIEGDTVTLDGNHPLAGQELRLEVSVLNVEEPTFDELEAQIMADLSEQDAMEEDEDEDDDIDLEEKKA